MWRTSLRKAIAVHSLREPMYETEAHNRQRCAQTQWGRKRETLSSQFKLKKKKKGTLEICVSVLAKKTMDCDHSDDTISRPSSEHNLTQDGGRWP